MRLGYLTDVLKVISYIVTLTPITMKMFMKSTLLSFLLAFLATITYAQHVFDEKIYSCNYSGMSMESSKIEITYSSPVDFYRDLLKDVNPRFLDKLEGEIYLQILIDKNLDACCISIRNNSNVSSGKLKLAQNISRMKSWVNLTNKPRAISAIFKVISKSGKVIIERYGASPGREPVLLESVKI